MTGWKTSNRRSPAWWRRSALPAERYFSALLAFQVDHGMAQS